MTFSAIISVMLLGMICARAELTEAQAKERFPWMTPEMCSVSSPDEMFLKLPRDEPVRAGFTPTEQGQDALFAAYAARLVEFDDKNFPLTTKIRKPVNQAFDRFFWFIRTANGDSSVAHYTARLPARLEWMISSGVRNNFKDAPVARYTLDDLRSIARIYEKSMRHEVLSYDNTKILTDSLEAGIKSLQEAETHLNAEGASYFRAGIVRMFCEYMVL